LDEANAQALREAFLSRLEDVSGNTVEAAAGFQTGLKRLGARLQRLDESLEELNSHLAAFGEFMESLISSYDGDATGAREDLQGMLAHIAEIAKFLRKKA